jgi:hypothetical protein
LASNSPTTPEVQPDPASAQPSAVITAGVDSFAIGVYNGASFLRR